jgi:hypothetical protein
MAKLFKDELSQSWKEQDINNIQQGALFIAPITIKSLRITLIWAIFLQMLCRT